MDRILRSRSHRPSAQSVQVGEVELARALKLGEAAEGLGHACRARESVGAGRRRASSRESSRSGAIGSCRSPKVTRSTPLASRRASTNGSIGTTDPRTLNESAPSNGRSQGLEEGRGHVADVLEVLEPAVADGEVPAGGDRLDRLGRLAGDAEVAADAVDRPGAKPDAGDPPVEPVDLGVQLVADLEGPVMGQWGEADLVADRPGRIPARPARGRRRSWRRPPARPALSRRRRPRRPRASPGRSPWRRASGLARQVGTWSPARWSRCVASTRSAAAEQGRGVAHVPLDEVDASQALLVEQEVEPVPVLLEVVDPDLAAFLDQLPGHPRPDAAVAARHQHAHPVGLRWSNRSRSRMGLERSRSLASAASSFSQVTGFSR